METSLLESNICERVVPVGNIQLMFHYKKPFKVHHPDNNHIEQPRSIITGLNNTYSDVSTQGEAGVVFIEFYPAEACHFFDFPLNDIENQSINLTDIFNSEIKEVEELIQSKESFEEKVKVVEGFLLKRFMQIPSHEYKILKEGVKIIKEYKGQIKAASLSDKLSVTTKSLERKFSKYIGTTPKQFIKLIRFQEILSDLSYNNLTEYACKNGYFDQSHFIRDFKAYSGLTPREFLIRHCKDTDPAHQGKTILSAG